MSWRMSGLRVTIPVPRGKLETNRSVGCCSTCRDTIWMRQLLTSLVPQCFPAQSSFHSTAILRLRFGADLWGFGPAARRQYGHSCDHGGHCGEGTTYSDCCKDILKLVDEGNKPWVVDINAIGPEVSIQRPRMLPRGAAGIGTKDVRCRVGVRHGWRRGSVVWHRASVSLVCSVSVQSSWVYGRCGCSSRVRCWWFCDLLQTV
jgi:hypothetical protein